MPTVNQQSMLLESQNQLRNADKLARDWAIAHAGRYQGQARRELRGSAQFQEWKRDNLTIRISKPLSLAPGVRQGQIVSVRYEPAAPADGYAGYLMTYGNGDHDGGGGYCISVLAMSEALDDDTLPWDEKAGPAGLDALLQPLQAERGKTAPDARKDSAVAISSVEDLFALPDAAIVLTQEGQNDEAFLELAARHDDWARIVEINAQEQLVLGRELTFQQVGEWIWAKLAVFNRYAGPDGTRLRLIETDPEKAGEFLDAERDRTISGISNRNSLTLLEMLESLTSLMATFKMPEAQKAIAEALLESAADGESNSPVENMAAQQRVYVLQDQLDEANFTIEELKERLAIYESYDDGSGDDSADDADDGAPETAESRETMVLAAIGDTARFPRLRFLTNSAKPLADFGKQRPHGAEIVAALDAIDALAQAWHNSPGGSIGNWDNYFMDLKPGWTHANGESSFTMSRYGDKRSFSDQEQKRRVTIERHLTYRGSNSGLQIYFDRDDATDKFIVGYIGEHLPYATNRS